MDMPVDYHVCCAVGAMLEHYGIQMPKLTYILLSWMTVLSTIRNDLLHDFINKAIISFLCNRFRSWVAATGGLWHCKHSV